MNNSFIIPLLFALVLQTTVITEVFADFKCTGSISFVLEKEAKSSEVFDAEVRAVAADELKAKSQTEASATKLKAKAMQECQKLYENNSGCLQTKLESAAQALQAASFTARKALEDSLISDCKKQQANCKDTKVSEIKCEELINAAAPEAAAKETKDKGTVDKKAKK